jgi:ribosomal protein S27E
MAKSFGVLCKKCGKHIHITDVESEGHPKIVFYAVPLTPIVCGNCGHTDDYSSKDNHYQ